MDSPDPLAELLEHLERDGDVPLAWVVEHAPDGDLRRVWGACDDARTLLRCARHVPRHALVLAACACARSAFATRGPNESAHDVARRQREIAATEAWARGELTAEALAAEMRRTVFSTAPHGVVGTLLGSRDSDVAWYGAHLANEAAELLAGGRRRGQAGYRAALARHADTVRAHLPCPTLEQLRAAFRERRG